MTDTKKCPKCRRQMFFSAACQNKWKPYDKYVCVCGHEEKVKE